MVKFDNTYSQLPENFYSRIAPDEVSDPEILIYNKELSKKLNVENWAEDILSGNVLPEGADPIAQVYAAHQFGSWVPRLGDGRAVLLGEIETDLGRFDIQLKGAGRTPYSRNGDGKLWLGPALREYLISEYMHRIGIPSTRSLSVCRTGEKVQREKAFPGAILARVASSHIRFGTFEYFTSQQDYKSLRLLVDYTRERHYKTAPNGIIGLYSAMIKRTAKLIAHWMSVGFIHGVMNTDNMSIAGETLDYGPCAFMDEYTANAVFSSIDHQARYAYGNQAQVAHWNLAQLGSCFVPLLAEEIGDEKLAIESLTATLNEFRDEYSKYYTQIFAAKLGMSNDLMEDSDILSELLTLMQRHKLDFTNTFASLTYEGQITQITDVDEIDQWQSQWKSMLQNAPDVEKMKASNPVAIPRNHQIEKVIQASLLGNDDLLYELENVLKNPFEYLKNHSSYYKPATNEEMVTNTFCGT